MDKLVLVPIFLAAAYFLYRYIRRIISGTGGCHGDCDRCSQEVIEKEHKTSPSKVHAANGAPENDRASVER